MAIIDSWRAIGVTHIVLWFYNGNQISGELSREDAVKKAHYVTDTLGQGDAVILPISAVTQGTNLRDW